MVASRPFETLSIDVTGPHPRSANGYIFILTIVDHFSKFAFAYPMRNQEASTVAKILVEQVICLVGTPARILTDQGPNFESELFKKLCRMMGIAKIRTSPYKPSTNAGAERFHLTLNSMLAKQMKENQRDWDLHIQPVLAAYRATRHSSTSLTPNFVVFGRENVMPADLVLGNPNVLPECENSVNDYVAEQQERFRSAYQVARNHLRASAQKRKSYYDAGVRAKELNIGDRVWYFYPRKYVKRSRKWSFVYVGPYTVTKKLSDLTYAIQKSPRDKVLIVHIDKLKKCIANDVNDTVHTPRVNVVSCCMVHTAAIPGLDLPGTLPPSQLLEEDTESTGMTSFALEVLVDASTMQFQALSLPPDEIGGRGMPGKPSLPMDVGTFDLSNEVSEFLRAANPQIEGCFTFDLGDIVDGCKDDL